MPPLPAPTIRRSQSRVSTMSPSAISGALPSQSAPVLAPSVVSPVSAMGSASDAVFGAQPVSPRAARAPTPATLPIKPRREMSIDLLMQVPPLTFAPGGASLAAPTGAVLPPRFQALPYGLYPSERQGCESPPPAGVSQGCPALPRWGDLLKFSQLKSIKCLILETSPPPMPYNGQNHLGGSRTRDNRVGLCGVKGAQAGVNPALPGALRSLRHRRLLVECQRVLLCVVLLRHRARDCHLCQRRGVSRSVRRVGGQSLRSSTSAC